MITIYSTKSCGKCMAVKKILTTKGIDFKNVFIEGPENEENITRVPTLIADDGSRYEDVDALIYVRSL